MAYVTGTTHYNLPQTVGTDKRDWADTNQAFADVDAALYGAVDDVAAAATEITALKGRMDTAETNIGQNTSDIAGLDTRLTTAEGAITSQQSQITDTRQDLEDMICAYNEATATSTHAYEIGDYFIYNDVLYRAIQAIAIGDTIVPDTNCTTTNVTTELLALDNSNFVNTDVICLFVESSTTSAHNYSTGDYFILNDVLYIVTTSITVGDTLTLGSNCDNTSVTNELVRAMQHTKFTLLYAMDDTTATSAWNGGEVQLSDDWTNYDAIGILIKDTNNRSYSKLEILYQLNASTDTGSIMVESINGTGVYIHGRDIYRVNDTTKIGFTDGYAWSQNDNTPATNHNVAYPYRIYGVIF